MERFRGPVFSLALATGAVVLAGGLWFGLQPLFKGSGYTRINSDSPSVRHADGLTLSVAPADLTSDFRIRLASAADDAFLDGQAGKDWEAARAALPGQLTLVGFAYGIQTTGDAPDKISLTVDLPADAGSPQPLDLYGFFDGTWSFIPGRVTGNQMTGEAGAVPSVVAVFRANELIPFASTALEEGQTFDPAAVSALNAVHPTGLRAQPDGSLAGALVGGFTLGQGYSVMPVIRNYAGDEIDRNVLEALLRDDAHRAAHVQNLVGFAVTDGYAGVIIDYRGVDFNLSTGFARFIRELADGMHAQNKALGVVVEAPMPFGDGFATGGYDWRAIGAAADAVEIPVSDDPTAFGNGQADRMLQWAAGELSRYKIRLVTSSLPVQNSAGKFATVAYDAALQLLGAPTLSGDASALQAGATIQVSLSGQVQSVEYDQNAFASRLDIAGDGGPSTVWLTSPDTLLHRATLAQKHRLGGVAVRDYFDPRNAAGMADAVTQYKVNAAAAGATTPGLIWTVSGADGVVMQSTGVPGQPFEYVAQAPGDLTIGAEFVDGSSAPLGSVGVNVAPPATATPTPAPTTAPRPTSGGGNTGPVTPAPTKPPPPPAVLPKVTGNFELGGQVVNGIQVGPMQTAGMKWVKTQARGGNMSGFIAAAHGAGLKVLLTVLLDHGRAADPAYWPEVAAYAAAQAAAGADAIEVWNEMNIDAEWPAGQINPATYVEMLKVVYPAIKGANPGTMVVSGALAPTGAEGAFPGRVMNDDNYLRGMAAAGAANYMDCVGIHYNTGTTSPSATTGSALSGYHYSYYFWPMVDLYYGAFGGARQLCFTELGYLSADGYGSLPGAFSWAAGVTVAHQAAWLAEAASLSSSSGKVRLMIVWNVDSMTWTHDPQAGYAIIRPDGSCPACSSLGSVAR